MVPRSTRIDSEHQLGFKAVACCLLVQKNKSHNGTSKTTKGMISSPSKIELNVEAAKEISTVEKQRSSTAVIQQQKCGLVWKNKSDTERSAPLLPATWQSTQVLHSWKEEGRCENGILISVIGQDKQRFIKGEREQTTGWDRQWLSVVCLIMTWKIREHSENRSCSFQFRNWRQEMVLYTSIERAHVVNLQHEQVLIYLFIYLLSYLWTTSALAKTTIKNWCN